MLVFRRSNLPPPPLHRAREIRNLPPRHNLSTRSSNFGSAGGRPLRARTSFTIWFAMVPSLNGSSSSTCQCEKEHCANAWPCVASRRVAVRPKEPSTGRCLPTSKRKEKKGKREEVGGKGGGKKRRKENQEGGGGG